jgi:prepilin peptidase CpaA
VESPKIMLIAAVVLFTLVAAICDFRTKKLPNWLTVPSFIAGLAYHIVSGALTGGWSGAWHGVVFAMAGFATGFGILFVLWLIGGGGAGDVKMMGALGAWLGATLTLYVFLISTTFVILGSVGTLTFHMLSKGWGFTKRFMSPLREPAVLPRNTNRQTALEKRRIRRRLMPYGVPVALATWTVLALAWTQSHG